jgi:hypothetical protein
MPSHTLDVLPVSRNAGVYYLLPGVGSWLFKMGSMKERYFISFFDSANALGRSIFEIFF